MVTLSLGFLFAVMGLAIDLGYSHYVRIRVQTAADAAAISAAIYARNNSETCGASCGTEYTCAGVTPPTSSLQAGCLYATQDGPQVSAKLLENNTSPPGVTGNTPSLWFKATVSTSSTNWFGFMSGYATTGISAQAIAGVTVIPPAYCVYVLNNTAQDALSLGGSAALTTSGGCGIYVNSNNPRALHINGSASINAGGGSIKVVGGSSYPAGSLTPVPTHADVPLADPLASLVGPTVGSCSFGTATTPTVVSSAVSLSPGVYCGGISVVNNGVATLSPGVYILNGNGLTVSGSGALTGARVMFYNTATSGRTAGPVAISGSGSISISAPTSGTYRGVAFFQDRNVSYADANGFSSNSLGNIAGTLYFKTTAISISGSSSSTEAYYSLISDTLTLSGSTSLTADNNGTHTAGVTAYSTLIQ